MQIRANLNWLCECGYPMDFADDLAGAVRRRMVCHTLGCKFYNVAVLEPVTTVPQSDMKPVVL